MMKKHYFIFLLFLTFFNSCASVKKTPQTPQKFWFDTVSERYLSYIKSSDTPMYIKGSGGGMKGGKNHDKITRFFFSFKCNKVATIPTARQIAINSIQKFIEIVDLEPNIHPHLLKYPFDRTTTMGFILEFSNSKNEKDCTYVDTVFFSRDSLKYCTWDPIEKTFTTIYLEPYDEALRICGYL